MLYFLAILILLISFGLMAFLFDGTFGKLDFTSDSAISSLVVSQLKLRRLEKGNFVDLGSARGGFALKIAKALPKMKIFGVDDSAFRTRLAKARSIFLKNTSFSKQNIFKADVSRVDAAYIYLPQELMPDLQNKLQTELKPGAVVMANRVSFPSWPPEQTINQLSIYVKK